MGVKMGIFETGQNRENAHMRNCTSDSIRDLRDTGAVGAEAERFELHNVEEDQAPCKPPTSRLVDQFMSTKNKAHPKDRASVNNIRELSLVGEAIDDSNRFNP